jgi:hypothetical protein
MQLYRGGGVGGLLPNIKADAQLRCLADYLATTGEGSGFRERLGDVVDDCRALGHQGLLAPELLLGPHNYVDGRGGSPGERSLPHYPVGKGGDGSQTALDAEAQERAATEACFLRPPTLTRLRIALAALPPARGHPSAWDEMAVGRQRVLPEREEFQDEPSNVPRPELLVVATLVEKVPNLAGLCRTAEVLRADRLVLASRTVLADPAFKELSMGAERHVAVEAVPEEWLIPWLLEQVRPRVRCTRPIGGLLPLPRLTDAPRRLAPSSAGVGSLSSASSRVHSPSRSKNSPPRPVGPSRRVPCCCWGARRSGGWSGIFRFDLLSSNPYEEPRERPHS